MAIKTGIGVGAAQVYDFSPVINNLYKMYERKQKERDEFAAGIADSLSKFDSSGLYGEDLKEINDLYSTIKAKNYAVENMTDLDKALAKTSVSKDIQALNERVANIKKWNLDKQKLLLDIAEDGSKYTDEARNIATKIKDLPFSKAGDYADLTKVMLMRKPDTSAIEKGLSYFNNIAEEVAKSNAGKQMDTTSNGIITSYRTVDPGILKPQAKALILSNDDIEFSLKEAYKNDFPDQPTPNADQLTDYFMKIREGRLGPTAYQVTVGQRQVQKPRAEKTSTSDDFASAINGMFSDNEAERIKFANMIKAQGKGKVWDIQPNGTGWNVTPAITTKIGDKIMPPRAGKTIFVQDANKMYEYLGSIGVGSAGFKTAAQLRNSKQTPSQTPRSNQEATITFEVNGRLFNIPQSKVSAFLKANPKAKRK